MGVGYLTRSAKYHVYNLYAQIIMYEQATLCYRAIGDTVARQVLVIALI